jgi:hypothetical protein
MPISIACPHCDWKGRVKDELAGKKGKCPTCGELIPIPLKGSPPPVPAGARAVVDDAPDVVDEADIVEDSPRPSSKPGGRPAPASKGRRDEDEDDRPRRRRDDDEDDDRPSRSRQWDEEDEDRPSRARRRPADDDDDDRPRKKRRGRDDDYDDYDDRPRRRRKKAQKPEHGGWFGLEKGILSGGVIGGGIAMLIAVVWFVLGQVAGVTFFYPPVLFVIGLIAFIRGLVSGGE